MRQAGRPPKARVWVSRPRRGIVAYLRRLEASGTLRSEDALFGTRWRIVDAGRVGEAAARLDAIAHSAGPVDTADAAFGGPAHAAGLDAILFRGLANREPRARLRRIAEGKVAGLSRRRSLPMRSAALPGQPRPPMLQHTRPRMQPQPRRRRRRFPPLGSRRCCRGGIDQLGRPAFLSLTCGSVGAVRVAGR